MMKKRTIIFLFLIGFITTATAFDYEISYLGQSVKNSSNVLYNGTYTVTSYVFTDPGCTGTPDATAISTVTFTDGNGLVTFNYTSDYTTFYIQPGIESYNHTCFKYTATAQAQVANNATDSDTLQGYSYSSLPISGNVTGTLSSSKVSFLDLNDIIFTGLFGYGNLTLCGADEILEMNAGGTAWECAADTTNDAVESSELDGVCTTDDRVLRRSGGTWDCYDDSNYLDDTDTLWTIGLLYLYNDTGTLTFNETKLNATVDARDSDTTYSALSEFDNDEGFFSSITNFTGTLTDAKWCVYDSANSEIDCNVEPVTGGGGNSTLEIIKAVNNTYLNGTFFQSIPCSSILFDTGVGAAGICDGDDAGSATSFDLNLTSDSGDSVILDAEIFTISGAGSVSTALSGNELTITGSDSDTTYTNASFDLGSIPGQITEADISDLSHTTDTNESVRFDALAADDCAAGYLVIGINDTGGVLCAADTDTTYSAVSEFDNDEGFFSSITNFTGTLTDAKWCVYDSANSEIDCNVEPVTDTNTDTNVTATTIQVTGGSTKKFTLEQQDHNGNYLANLTATWTDLDTGGSGNSTDEIRVAVNASVGYVFDTTGNAATATALAANGANCAAGSYPLGVDDSGAVEDCTDATTEIDSAISTHAATAHGNSTTEIQAVAVGGEVSGTVGSITLDDDALDDQYYDSEADLTGLLDDNYVDTTSDTMTGNLTLEKIILEKDSANHQIYDNTTCIIIKGDTATLEIC